MTEEKNKKRYKKTKKICYFCNGAGIRDIAHQIVSCGGCKGTGYMTDSKLITYDVPEDLLDEPLEWGGTLRTFFEGCLFGLWENDGFNGKRPGVDSGWHYEIVRVMMKYDESIALRDEDGEISEVKWDKAGKLYNQLIRCALGLDK